MTPEERAKDLVQNWVKSLANKMGGDTKPEYKEVVSMIYAEMERRIAKLLRGDLAERDREWVVAHATVDWDSDPDEAVADPEGHAGYVREREKLSIEIEREACAKVAEDHNCLGYASDSIHMCEEDVAAAIRARGASK